MNTKNIAAYRSILQSLVLVGCLISFIGLQVANAQSGIAQVKITNLDYSQFPIVQVQAQVLDSANMPVFSLTPAEIGLSEDGVVQTFEHRSEDKGIQVAFVLDMGSGISSPGGTGSTRIAEMKSIISAYVERIGNGDQVSIFTITGDKTTTVLKLESDKDTLKTAISALNVPSQIEDSFGLNAVYLALDDLNQGYNGRAQTVVFLSGGIQRVIAKTSEAEKYANSMGISIYSVLVRPFETDNTAPPLRNLSNNTKGLYTHYSKPTAIDDIFSALNKKRSQYIFTYHSQSATLAERVIELKLSNIENAPRDSAKYTVNVSPAQVIITQPASGAQFVRESDDTTIPVDAVEPTSAVVSAYAIWQDNYPRKIRTVELLIDGVTVSTLTDPGTEWSFAWDLRTYRILGEHNPQLSIKVTDEIGLVKTSDPVIVSVKVDILSTCADREGFDKFRCELNLSAGFAALAIAGITLILVVIGGVIFYRNREKLMQFGGQVSGQLGGAVQGAWERMTGGAKEKPSAYLKVQTEMYKQTLGSQVEIYRKTETPIGRNPMTNKIVIQDNREEPEVSKEHLVIRYDSSDNRWYIKDMDSTNGTKVNDVPLKLLTEEVLNDGDEITLGRLAYGGVKFQFSVVAAGDDFLKEDEDRITH